MHRFYTRLFINSGVVVSLFRRIGFGRLFLSYSFFMSPMNRQLPVALSWMAKKKGLFILIVKGCFFSTLFSIKTAVAAVATVPFSPTSMLAL